MTLHAAQQKRTPLVWHEGSILMLSLHGTDVTAVPLTYLLTPAGWIYLFAYLFTKQIQACHLTFMQERLKIQVYSKRAPYILKVGEIVKLDPTEFCPLS